MIHGARLKAGTEITAKGRMLDTGGGGQVTTAPRIGRV
jgi:hypothetical protein